MKRALILVATFPILVLCGACEQSSAQKDQTNATPPATPAAIADADIAVPADFEDEASHTITAANYKTELDQVETEIAN